MCDHATKIAMLEAEIDQLNSKLGRVTFQLAVGVQLLYETTTSVQPSLLQREKFIRDVTGDSDYKPGKRLHWPSGEING